MGKLLACPPLFSHMRFFYVGWGDLFSWTGLSSKAKGTGQDSGRGFQGNGKGKKLALLWDGVPGQETNVYLCFGQGFRTEGEEIKGMGPGEWRLSWDWSKGPPGNKVLRYLDLALALASVLVFPSRTWQRVDALK